MAPPTLDHPGPTPQRAYCSDRQCPMASFGTVRNPQKPHMARYTSRYLFFRTPLGEDLIRFCQFPSIYWPRSASDPWKVYTVWICMAIEQGLAPHFDACNACNIKMLRDPPHGADQREPPRNALELLDAPNEEATAMDEGAGWITTDID